jgi:hypothetical protein
MRELFFLGRHAFVYLLLYHPLDDALFSAKQYFLIFR